MPSRPAIAARSPIAVFDSGLGGLTVVRALRQELPGEDFIYYGDNARVPYGNKSAETVARFSSEICDFLLHFAPKCIIAACHTVSASAVGGLREQLHVPLLDMVQPSARLAAQCSSRDLIAVLGTEATIASGAYEQAIRNLKPRLRVVQQSCPLFVPIVEEGRGDDDPLTRLAIEDYLGSIKRLRPDVVLMGCTHYPMLRPALRAFFGDEVTLIDSGEAVAKVTRKLLEDEQLLSLAERVGTVKCYVSDFPQRFSAIGSRFLGEPLEHVTRACAERWHGSSSRTTRAISA